MIKYGYDVVGAAIAYAEHEYLAAFKQLEKLSKHMIQVGGDDFIRAPILQSLEDCDHKLTLRNADREDFYYHWSHDFRN